MTRLQHTVAVALAAASVSIPSVALAQRYAPANDQAIEQLAADIQRDRFELQRAEQARDWNKVHFERHQIQTREGRLHDMISRTCR